MNELAEVILVIGGDGAFIGATRDFTLPLVDINMGTLGFLADVNIDDSIRFLKELINGDYIEEKRSILKADITTKEGNVRESFYAFNEVVILSEHRGLMADFSLMQGNNLINTQRGDGLIIATPTGSTAYSLSAGEPIISPELPLMTVVSINPHSLSNRPIVVPDSSNLELVPENGQALSLIFDGAITRQLREEEVLKVKKAPVSANTIHPKTYDYYEVLREKLNWGKAFI